MTKFLILISMLTLMVGCQTSPQKKGKRVLASGQLFSKFIRQLSTQTNKSEEALEQEIIAYIKGRSANSNHPNYVALGITEDQAGQIKNLSDGHAFMPKVRKWAMENINKVSSSIDKKIAAEVYEAIVVAQRKSINPYEVISPTSNRRRNRQKVVSPISSISEKQERLLASIQQLENSKVEKVLRKNLAAMQERGMTTPAALANGQEIVESAATITRRTGLPAMGEGCEAFTKSASLEVLEIKANVDIYRARLVEQMVDNNGAGVKFTSAQLDDATKKSFQDVLGYTDDEATAALRRLKGKPCNLY